MSDKLDIDDRPKKGLWAAGNYFGTCCECNKQFIGDKRARMCAPCAYGSNDPIIENEPTSPFICKCETKFSIEPHGDAYALYLGRCNHKHGYNLAKISDIAHNCPSIKEIENLLNTRTNDKD